MIQLVSVMWPSHSGVNLICSAIQLVLLPCRECPLGSLAGLPLLSSGSGDPTRIGDAAITLGSHSHMLSKSIGSLAVQRVSVSSDHQVSSAPSVACSGATAPHNAALTISNISPWSLSGFAFGFALSGVYVREGLPPIPQKLVDKIRHREYIEMAAMLPEFWPLGKGEEKKSKMSPARRPKQMTDFHTWLQCFTTYASMQVY